MGKLLETFLLSAALALIGTAAQAQSPSKQPCSYEGKLYADGTTNPIGQICVAGAWGTAGQVQSTKQCFYVGRAFSDGSTNAEGKICDGQTGSWK
jgi:hypothetical protein